MVTTRSAASRSTPVSSRPRWSSSLRPPVDLQPALLPEDAGGDDRAVAELLNAALEGDLSRAKKLAKELSNAGKGLDEAVAAVGVTGSKGRGPLHLAAANGKLAMCKFLITKCAVDVDAADVDGATPLIFAIQGLGSTAIIKLLLSFGADPNKADINGVTPLHIAAERGSYEVAELLLSKEAEIDPICENGGAPIHVSAENGHAKLLKLLLEHKADYNRHSHSFHTPLAASLVGPSLECLKILTEAGADVNAGSPLTPLVISSGKGLTNCIKYLLKEGADANIPDGNGKLPVQIAARQGWKECVKILFPVTAPVAQYADWSVDGIFHHENTYYFTLEKENAELRRKLKALEADMQKMNVEHLLQLKQNAVVPETSLVKNQKGHILGLPDDVVAEILLHLPQNSPSCLLYASLVCKSWLSIISDISFLRRLRALHPTPEMLGFFQEEKFFPTAASAFSLPAATPRVSDMLILDCHHGRALFLVLNDPMFLLVWESVTGKQWQVPLPAAYFTFGFYIRPIGVVVCAVDDCDHRSCHGGHFFLLLTSTTWCEMDKTTRVWVYSSEAEAWGEPFVLDLIYSQRMTPSTIVERTVYLGFRSFTKAEYFIKYDLVEHELVVLKVPRDLLVLCDCNIISIPAEDGGLGFASVKDFTLSLWLCNDHAFWAYRVIDLDIPGKYDMVRFGYEIEILCFAEGLNTIFLDTCDGLYAIEIKSERVRRLLEKSPNRFLPLIRF
ncbi:unnamed protein product [Urochloa humidicola]